MLSIFFAIFSPVIIPAQWSFNLSNCLIFMSFFVSLRLATEYTSVEASGAVMRSSRLSMKAMYFIWMTSWVFKKVQLWEFRTLLRTGKTKHVKVMELNFHCVFSFRAVVQKANLRPGKTVLVHGASGAVSQMNSDYNFYHFYAIVRLYLWIKTCLIYFGVAQIKK